MSFQLNKYYSIASVGQDALTISETIIKSYPLTKMFSELLGKRLLARLEFGFFKPGFKVIEQGDKGKDLFLICTHKVMVIVDKQVIVTMPAPALLGDKGIIDRESIRSATIAVAGGGNCFVIKIPMEMFIRDAKRGDLKDEEFSQETKIFYNLFKEVQSRLFKYSKTQKNLWEEVNAQINSLNVQMISNIFQKKEEKEWDEKVWQVAKQYLQSVHSVELSENEKLTVSAFMDHLQGVVENKLHLENYEGKEDVYEAQKQILLKSIMDKVAGLLIKVLPDKQLPINLGEVELFNPRNYQMRMVKLLESIEEKFMFTKVKPKSDDFDKSSIKIDKFFGQELEENEFNLPSYLFTVQKNFNLRHPNRIMSQIAQQSAQLTAKVENEFNASVSKMQKFLEKIKKLTHVEQQKKEDKKPNVSKKMGDAIAVICKGLESYKQRVSGTADSHLGEIRLADMSTPLFADVIKACALDQQKQSVEKAFGFIVEAAKIRSVEFGIEQIKSHLFLCAASYKDIITSQQFSAHYWIPVTYNVEIWKDQNQVDYMKAGMVLGGDSWQPLEISDVEKPAQWQLRMPASKSNNPSDNNFFLFAVAERDICWRNKSTPSDDEFKQYHLPFAQWIINKHLETIKYLIDKRDDSFQKYSKVVEVIRVEKKVREFESKENKVDDAQYQKIIDLLYDNLGITLEKEEDISTDSLSKSLYESILNQTKSDFPTLSAEEQGNKAYTIWRFIQSEIVTTVYLEEDDQGPGVVTPEPVLKELAEKTEDALRKNTIEPDAALIDLSEDQLFIKLAELLATRESLDTGEQINLIGSIVTIAESIIKNIMDELDFYGSRLKKVNAINADFDVKEVQSKLVTESVKKLQVLLAKRLSGKPEV